MGAGRAPVLLRPRDRNLPLPLGPAGIRRAAPLGETTDGTHLVTMHARSFGALLTSVAVACHGGPRPLRLGTTYTVQQSGALAVLEAPWAGAPLALVVGPSGQILRSAAQGDLDVVITHAPALEARILGAAPPLFLCPLVASRFAIVGPPADPARGPPAR